MLRPRSHLLLAIGSRLLSVPSAIPDPEASIAEMRRLKKEVLSRLWPYRAVCVWALALQSCRGGPLHDSVQSGPHPVERPGNGLGIAQCLRQQLRPRSEDQLRHLEGLRGMAFLDHM